MPVRKKENLKNQPKSRRDTAIVPKKEAARLKKISVEKTAREPKGRFNALSTAGKKKRPK